MKKITLIAAVAAATSLANANEIADRLIDGTGPSKIETVELGAVEDMSKSVGVFSGCFSLTNVVLKSMSSPVVKKTPAFPGMPLIVMCGSSSKTEPLTGVGTASNNSHPTLMQS